ncbi:O-acetyl-ADP-ribose deacetylase (regulator of RNase III) [Nocardioides luteus]|nr:O-acetyl-ADP-ribose deacetylase (regulator of RNase III) [Nocardioides luteus]
MRITVVRGDITEQHVDAVVNAANSSLLGGGGVDGAIHRRGGPTILEECRRLRAGHLGGGLPVGQAVATTAGNLPARWVIHTVGPVFGDAQDNTGLLASCFRESLRVADELGARTVAFPAISTGVYRYPLEEAAYVSLWTLARTPTSVEEARLVLFDQKAYDAFDRAHAALDPSDAEVEAELRSMPEKMWRETFEAADGLTAEDRDWTWGGGQKMESGATQAPYPVYSDRVRQLYVSLPGANIDWMKWMSGNPLLSDPARLADLPAADAARLATVYSRGERFSDGVFGRALQDGSLDAIVARLRTWYDTER